MFVETKSRSESQAQQPPNHTGEVTAEQSFDEAVADVFPTFAKAEAAVLLAYAAWIALMAPWDGFIRAVLATMAAGSAAGIVTDVSRSMSIA